MQQESGTIRNFRFIAILEGMSYLILLFLAMPLKYLWDMPWMVRQTGLAHGVLFILYVVMLVPVHRRLNWGITQSLIAFAASLIPFGTFYVTSRMLPKRAA